MLFRSDAVIMGEKMNHLNRVVEQILDFARNSEPRFQRVDINALLDSLTLLTRHKFKQQRVQFERVAEPGVPVVSGDATQLEQAFLNLALNAAEAMPNGGSLTITTEAGQIGSNAAVAIEFKDTGLGMTAEQRERAFASLLKSTKASGNGIGLRVVKRVVEAHRGVFELESSLGRGTAVRILLPAAE